MRSSNQTWFCNNCGRKMFSPPAGAFLGGFGTHYSVCTIECSREMRWKDTLSMMGKEYYPQPEEKK